MKLRNTLLTLVISSLLLAACSTKDKKPDLLDANNEAAANGVGDASTNGLNGGSGLNGTEMGGNGYNNGSGGLYGSEDAAASLGPEFSDPSNPLSKRTIYFTLDSFQIDQEYTSIIAAHSQYLLANPSQHITLEGHGDERGSREYNIALGEQRAKSVAKIMKIQGVQPGQIGIVSYGEEKPAAMGGDESAWSLNRRVEINYQGK